MKVQKPAAVNGVTNRRFCSGALQVRRDGLIAPHIFYAPAYSPASTPLLFWPSRPVWGYTPALQADIILAGPSQEVKPFPMGAGAAGNS
jgi:hypothetical protein